jgi:uncharacterized protein YegL
MLRAHSSWFTHASGLIGAILLSAACGTSTVQSGQDGVSGDGLGTLDAGPNTPGREAGQDTPARDAGQTNGDGCNKATIAFESKLPAVLIVVDRSSSMFERGLWEPLKQGVLAIVQQLQADVLFGFTTYTGQAGGVCPDLSGGVGVEIDNYAAIRAAYEALAAPTYKGETPTSRAIDEATALLSAQPASTPKFILLVTDGEPDFCDDPNVVCARDAVVASAQQARAKGIGTLIFSVGGSVDRAHLQDVANAGSGLGVEDRQMAVASQCAGAKGSYSTPAGNAAYYEPNVNDQQALAGALSGAVAGLRSCIFDLQGQVEIDLSVASQGVVEIAGKRVPFGGADGFRMNSPTQLELLGEACVQLRKPESVDVSIDFPCEAIVLF